LHWTPGLRTRLGAQAGLSINRQDFGVSWNQILDGGSFYGTASGGGTKNGGVVFKIIATGKLTVLRNINGTTDGAGPVAGLVRATDGNFYGVNVAGGTTSQGTIFRISPTKHYPYKVLYNFDGTTGALPAVTLLQHTNGILYGDTQSGGTGNVGQRTSGMCGTFYSLNYWRGAVRQFGVHIWQGWEDSRDSRSAIQGDNGRFIQRSRGNLQGCVPHLSDRSGSNRRDDRLCDCCMCKATLRRLKSQMSGILRLAIELNYRPAPNPMREITLPRAPESEETEAYDLNAVFTLIRLLPEPDRTLVATAAFTGLRKSELRGLHWQDYDGATLTVTHSLWRGFLGEPKSWASRRHRAGHRCVAKDAGRTPRESRQPR
jgi:uncharacterized repeat protein (TIGR03803 family)